MKGFGIRGFLCVALLLTCLLSACVSESGTERNSIVLLHGYGSNSERDRKMREIYKGFELQYPDISLHLVSVPSFDRVEAKTKDMLAVGKTPNIIYTGGYTSDRFYHFMLDQGYLLDLLPYIQADAEFYADLSPKILRDWKEGNGLYTVTDTLSVRGYWYNKKIFANAGILKAPGNRAEFLSACEKINIWAEDNKYKTQPFVLDTEEAANLMQCLMGSKVSEDNPAYPLGDNEKHFMEGLEGLKELASLKRSTREYKKKDSLLSFNVGHSAMYIGEVWEGTLFAKSLDAEFAFFDDEEGKLPMYTALSGFMVSAFATQEQKEASLLFIRYMLGEKVQSELASMGFIPSNPLVYEREDLLLGEEYKQKLKEVQKTVYAPEKEWKGLSYAVFSAHVQNYLRGDLTAEEFLRYMQEERLP